MSWVSDFFGGGNTPGWLPQVQEIQRQAAAAPAAAAAAAQAQALAAARASATDTARTGAQQYFTERGLDPAQYSGDIDQTINSLLSGISTSDPNPGAYLQDVG